jgi:hypothetical protein
MAVTCFFSSTTSAAVKGNEKEKVAQRKTRPTRAQEQETDLSNPPISQII